MSEPISPPARRSPAHALRTTLREALDRFVASDPALTRLLLALQAVVSIGVTLAAEYALVEIARPLEVPAGAPGADAANTAVTVMAMMAGAMVAMVSTFAGPMFPTIRRGITGLVLLPVTMLAGVALGILTGPLGVLAPIALVVTLGGAGFLRRFGPWGFVIGQGLFMGTFLGLFLGHITGLRGLGWIAAELGIGSAVAVLAYLAILVPSRRTRLVRLRRSFLGRVRGVAGATLDVLDRPDSAGARSRQHTQLVKLNETALMIDAQLADPGGDTPARVKELHRRVFDAELAVANAARFIRELAPVVTSGTSRDSIRDALTAIGAQDATALRRAADRVRTAAGEAAETSDVTMHRLANALDDYADVLDGFGTSAQGPMTSSIFQPAVALASGWLPGSAEVSATASQEHAGHRTSLALPPWARAGIQMTVAGALAVLLGSWVSPDRFYWAVLAAFVTFMGANTAAEQVRKGGFRVIGTVIGVLIGAVLAHVVGDAPAASIAIILTLLFIGIYLMRVSYAVFATAITILVAQLYVQLAEFSLELLGLRLVETLIGAAAAILVVAVVVPLRTDHVVRVAAREFVDALTGLIRPVILRLRDPSFDARLPAATRTLDAAFQALAAATAPNRAVMRVPGALGGVGQSWWYATNAAHSYARDLSADAARARPMPEADADDFAEAVQVLMSSANALSRGLHERGSTRVYTRAASLIEAVADRLDDRQTPTDRQLALRDLQAINGALANLARSAGIAVRSYRDDDAQAAPTPKTSPSA